MLPAAMSHAGLSGHVVKVLAAGSDSDSGQTRGVLVLGLVSPSGAGYCQRCISDFCPDVSPLLEALGRQVDLR